MRTICRTFLNVFQENKDVNFSELLIAIVLITLPLGSYVINSIAIILFFSVGLFNVFKKKQNFSLNKVSFLIISFYLVFLISLFWTNNVNNTINGLTRFLSYLILPIAFGFCSRIPISKEKILNLFFNSLIFYGLYCVFWGAYNSYFQTDLSNLFYHKLSGNLGDINAIYLSVFVSLGIFFFMNKKKTKLNVSSIIFLILFLILLSSKLIIVFTVLYLLMTISFKKIKFSYVFITVGILFIFIVASKNLSNRVVIEFQKTKIEEILNKKDFGHIYLWTGTGLRIFQIKMFFEILQENENILLGFGLNNSQNSLNNKYKQYNLYPGFLNYNYHNQYIQVLSELGILGFLVLLSIFFSLFYRAIIMKEYFLLYFIILILAICMTESFIWRQKGMVFFLTISLLCYNGSKTVPIKSNL